MDEQSSNDNESTEDSGARSTVSALKAIEEMRQNIDLSGLYSAAAAMDDVEASVTSSLYPTVAAMDDLNASVATSLYPAAAAMDSLDASVAASLYPAAAAMNDLDASITSSLYPTVAAMDDLNASVATLFYPAITNIAEVNQRLNTTLSPTLSLAIQKIEKIPDLGTVVPDILHRRYQTTEPSKRTDAETASASVQTQSHESELYTFSTDVSWTYSPVASITGLIAAYTLKTRADNNTDFQLTDKQRAGTIIALWILLVCSTGSLPVALSGASAGIGAYELTSTDD